MAETQFQIGAIYTIAGVYRADTRSRWRKIIDRLLRRQAPAKVLQEFKITSGGDFGC